MRGESGLGGREGIAAEVGDVLNGGVEGDSVAISAEDANVVAANHKGAVGGATEEKMKTVGGE